MLPPALELSTDLISTAEPPELGTAQERQTCSAVQHGLAEAVTAQVKTVRLSAQMILKGEPLKGSREARGFINVYT
jgi:hypothetical protein